MDGLSFTSIEVDEGSLLETDFEENEVFEVVRALNGDKDPGPMDSLWRSSNLLGGR